MIDAMDDIPRARPFPADESDEALARRAAADREAFAELYRRYLPRIYAYCHSRLGSREAAEDATGQIFLNAYQAIPRFRADNLRAWLFSIAHHVVTDVHRQRGSPLPIDRASDVSDAGPGPEQLSLAGDASAELRRAVHRLPADQQRVIELRLAGLTGPEIRTVLGKSRPWVDTTQHRAVQRLRRLMSAAPTPDPTAAPTEEGPRHAPPHP